MANIILVAIFLITAKITGSFTHRISIITWLLFLFLGLSTLATVYGQIIPSFNLGTCTSDQLCSSKMQVLAYLSQSTSGLYQISATIPAQFSLTDGNGFTYSVKEPVVISLSLQNIHFIYTMTSTGNTYHSVSESNVPQPSFVCPSSSLCCPKLGGGGTVHSLLSDPVTFEASTVSQAVTTFDVVVSISQGSLVKEIRMSVVGNRYVDEVSGVAGTILTSRQDILALPNFDSFLYMRDVSGSANPAPSFLVPTTKFCLIPQQIACIGLTPSAYLSAVRCGSSPNILVQLQGSTISDQWSQFRSVSLASKMSSLQSTLLTSNVNLRTETYSNVVPLNTEVLLELYATQFAVQRLVGTPVIMSFVVSITPGDPTLLQLSGFIRNAASVKGVFEMRGDVCCVGVVCSATAIDAFITMEGQVTQPFSGVWRIPSSAVAFIGYCNISVWQFGTFSLHQQAAFSLAPPTLPPTPAVTTPSPLGLQCTVDQVVDVTVGCRGVNCTAKYGTMKSFFNLFSRLCEAVAVCPGGQVYDSGYNSCAATAAPTKPFFIPFIPGTGSPNSQINCTVHGYLNPATNATCLCFNGWFTGAGQDVFNFKWCSLADVVISSDWTTVPFDTSTLVMLGLGLSGVVVLGLFCYLSVRYVVRYAANVEETAGEETTVADGKSKSSGKSTKVNPDVMFKQKAKHRPKRRQQQRNNNNDREDSESETNDDVVIEMITQNESALHTRPGTSFGFEEQRDEGVVDDNSSNPGFHLPVLNPQTSASSTLSSGSGGRDSDYSTDTHSPHGHRMHEAKTDRRVWSPLMSSQQAGVLAEASGSPRASETPVRGVASSAEGSEFNVSPSRPLMRATINSNSSPLSPGVSPPRPPQRPQAISNNSSAVRSTYTVPSVARRLRL